MGLNPTGAGVLSVLFTADLSRLLGDKYVLNPPEVCLPPSALRRTSLPFGPTVLYVDYVIGLFFCMNL